MWETMVAGADISRIIYFEYFRARKVNKEKEGVFLKIHWREFVKLLFLLALRRMVEINPPFIVYPGYKTVLKFYKTSKNKNYHDRLAAAVPSNSGNANTRCCVINRCPKLELNPVSVSVLWNNLLRTPCYPWMRTLDISVSSTPRFCHVVECKMRQISLPGRLGIVKTTSRGARSEWTPFT